MINAKITKRTYASQIKDKDCQVCDFDTVVANKCFYFKAFLCIPVVVCVFTAI